MWTGGEEEQGGQEKRVRGEEDEELNYLEQKRETLRQTRASRAQEHRQARTGYLNIRQAEVRPRQSDAFQSLRAESLRQAQQAGRKRYPREERMEQNN